MSKLETTSQLMQSTKYYKVKISNDVSIDRHFYAPMPKFDCATEYFTTSD
jgi:hypothetical protein